jgi:hypothetical protein
MSRQNIFVAKSQQRRGLRRNLPQPLKPGEIGFCTDTEETFIGGDAGLVNAFRSLSMYVYNFTDTYEANNLLNEHIFMVDVPVGQTIPDGIADYQITATRNVDRLIKYPADYVPNIQTRLYLGYIISPGSSVIVPDIGLALPVGLLTMFESKTSDPLEAKGDTTSNDFYTTEDTGAIVTMLNALYGGEGLASVTQNIRLGNVNSTDNLDIGNLPVGDNILATFLYEQAVSITLDYSLNYNNLYTRVGSIQVACDVDGLISLNDSHNEIVTLGVPNDPTVWFEATTTTVNGYLEVILTLKDNTYNGLGIVLDTIRWSSPFGCVTADQP